eukprot:11175872-Lingulodinium_polyedra.AAC.1
MRRAVAFGLAAEVRLVVQWIPSELDWAGPGGPAQAFAVGRPVRCRVAAPPTQFSGRGMAAGPGCGWR